MDEILLAAPFEGDSFWDPVAASWPLMALLGAICLVLTIGFAVWLVLQPEEPELDTAPLVDKAVRADRDEAALIRRRLDADSGRADVAEPELR
ncbi:MAG TPA: hypothetical protein H9932_03305 [Candidatus Brachybacterium intestinipullorum]|uniref:Uncharacterized protein n=1 Tax=Candidatus Brachybacterium intestinipullorum TaxID=2838512 RepID=A0A9D2TG37_9MICO|nr:hypothetical protein [Candidatus Brachybacterium intestinipullorum]